MSVKFQVKMTTKVMYQFLIHYTYTQVGGIIGTAFGGISLGIGIHEWGLGEYSFGLICFAFALIFLVMPPITLRGKAKKQVVDSGLLDVVIDYELAEEGITTTQGDSVSKLKWEELLKAVTTNNSIIVYITKVHVFIFPKKDLGEQYIAVVNMISTHMPPDKVNLKSA